MPLDRMALGHLQSRTGADGFLPRGAFFRPPVPRRACVSRRDGIRLPEGRLRGLLRDGHAAERRDIELEAGAHRR